MTPTGRGAPVVVAKGERLLAEQIKQVAREARVPIFRDVTLTRSLRDVEEDEIPEVWYKAVAELLAVAGRSCRRDGQPADPEGGGGRGSDRAGRLVEARVGR